MPEPIQDLFTAAFTERGVSGRRPTAQEWVTALDGLRGQLRRCSSSQIHVYSGHVGHCPWCDLANEGVIYFLDVRTGTAPAGTIGFIVARVWAGIDAIPAPPVITLPNIASIPASPTPLPHGIDQTVSKTILRILIVGLGVVLMFVNLFLWPLILVGGYLAWVVVGTLGTAELTAERARREAACSAAQRAYDQTVNRVLTEGTPEAFRKKKAELAHLRDEYIQLPKREGDELATLHATAESRQKQRYLGRQFIDEASIPGVGLAKKATLRSFGIETAADVTRQNVAAVKGFGQVLTRSVMAWRYSCERRFVFDPSIAVTDADKSAVRAKIEARKRTIETSLRAGAGELERLRHDMTKKAVELIPLLQAASRTLAQAQADLRAV